MAKTSIITARIEPELSVLLDDLAKKTDRSRAWIVAKAIENYVEEQSAFLAFLKEGDDAIDRGEYYTQEEMEKWFASLHKTADAA